MHTLRRLLPPLTAWLIGLLVAFYPMLLSGFALVPGDLGDARLINFVLEHDWRWLRGGEDCPWYPTMRLFRQLRRHDWAEVFVRVAAELERLVSTGQTLVACNMVA